MVVPDLRKLATNLPKEPIIQVLGTYLLNTTSYHKEICSTMFIETLYGITRIWKPSRYFSTEE